MKTPFHEHKGAAGSRLLPPGVVHILKVSTKEEYQYEKYYIFLFFLFFYLNDVTCTL